MKTVTKYSIAIGHGSELKVLPTGEPKAIAVPEELPLLLHCWLDTNSQEIVIQIRQRDPKREADARIPASEL